MEALTEHGSDCTRGNHARDLGDEVAAFLPLGEARGRQRDTLATYAYACRSFADWLIANGRPTDVEAITRRDV